jgi:hypothetical protein
VHNNTFQTSRVILSLPVAASEQHQIEDDTATFSGRDWSLSLRSTNAPSDIESTSRAEILRRHARRLLEADSILPEGIRFTPKIIVDREGDEPSLFIMGISESRTQRIVYRIFSTVEDGVWWLHAARFCHAYRSPEHDDSITDALLKFRRI